MKKNLIYGMLLCLFGATAASCSDDQEVFFEDVIGEEDIEVVHPNERDKPYPREEHELYVNPAPLIVPRSVKEQDESLEFELSQDSTFASESVYRSGQVEWHMYNIHEQMTTGMWYWRFRVIDTTGKAGPWSEINKFTVTGKEPVFVTPSFETLKQNIPTTYPRLNCFLDEDIQKLTLPLTEEHPEFKDLRSRANSALSITLPSDPYDYNLESLATDVRYKLEYGYILLKGQQYYDKILELGRALINHGITDDKIRNLSNFNAGGAVETISICYDLCQNDLTENEKAQAEDIISRFVDYYYNTSHKGRIENHVFENHTWQMVMFGIFEGALTICQEYPKAMEALEYYYELWTARAPASGFNRDGAWINGTGYFDTNSYTLYYMPMIFSHLTGFNFLEHPWYKNLGRALTYSWLPDTYTTGFGDIGNPTQVPFRIRVAFADIMARELQDPYAHSDLEYIEDNISLSFRSSTFGSGSHTLADQNSFKLLYKGVYVYMNAGYYQNFSDAHNLLQFRNTRGHNTIMINNIGQPFTTRAYGNIPRALNGKNIAYFLGDASHAYCGTSEYSMWQDAFENAGLSQTPEYGFGETPLNNYKRHIFMLRPNKVVIYDDLGADEPATWQWLLHSPVEFNIAGNKITTHYEDKGGFTSVAQIYSNQIPEITKTNEWFPGGEPSEPADKQWHLTANFGACQNNRILTIIQLSDDGTAEEIWQVNNTFIMGDWTIEAEMDANSPAAITISNSTSGCVFSYGADAPMINGTPYQRQVEGSSVLYDEVGGSMQVQEISDKPVQTTRSIN